MDTRVAFGPDTRVTAASALATVLAVGALFTVGDASGRLLIGIAVVVLGLCTALGMLYRPTLVAATSGLQLRTPTAWIDLGWDQVVTARVDDKPHLGLRAGTLEIEYLTAGEVGDERIVVLSRRALGADPHTVLGILAGFGVSTR